VGYEKRSEEVVGIMTLKCKIWENGSMLFEDTQSELFLHTEQIKYCVNWLNLHNEDLENNKFSPIVYNEEYGITISSVNGITAFTTHGYFALYNREQLSLFKKYINGNRERIGCQEVLE
jgi:hypothetical protein